MCKVLGLCGFLRILLIWMFCPLILPQVSVSPFLPLEDTRRWILPSGPGRNTITITFKSWTKCPSGCVNHHVNVVDLYSLHFSAGKWIIVLCLWVISLSRNYSVIMLILCLVLAIRNNCNMHNASQCFARTWWEYFLKFEMQWAHAPHMHVHWHRLKWVLC